jgi:transposase InsO family protein
MSIKMPKTIKEERLRWVLPIVNKHIKLKALAKVCPHGQRTLERWVANYKQSGEVGLEPQSTRPKSHPKDTPIRLKEYIVELRQQTKKSALKLHWQLEKEYINIHERTIGKILKQEGLVRKYRVKRVKYKYLKATLKPGELVEIDVKYVPQKLNKQRYYQYTAIDCASRWRHLEIYDDQNNDNTQKFLHTIIQRFPYPIQAIKTDNHSTFTNRYTGYRQATDPMYQRPHILDLECLRLGITHYLIDPGKPAQNGRVERSHRSDQECFYDHLKITDPEQLKLSIRLWNMYYNDLEHCGLNGRTPNQMLQLFQH